MRETVWIGCSHGGKYKAEYHGVCSTSTCSWGIIAREGEEGRCLKIVIKCAKHNHERTDDIAAFYEYKKAF